MRASKKYRSQKSKVKSKNLKHCDPHISGAEGIYEDLKIYRITGKYIDRALSHSRGIPDKIVITMEKLKQKPEAICALPVATLKCISLSEAKKLIKNLLKTVSVSETAIKSAFKVLNSKQAMRGASLVRSVSGIRIEPDKTRGIRASRLGISLSAERILSSKLHKKSINNTTVKEAVMLASKVASCDEVIAELCISDDPDYTTGYISSGHFGYIRIPNIKHKGDRKGGRVFFVKEKADRDSLIKYLEETPVIINKISECMGVLSLDEILNCHNS